MTVARAVPLAARATVLAVLLIAGLAAGMITGPKTARADGTVPFPMIPKAAPGTTCLRDPEVMRRTHMDLLKHQRDDTLRRGARASDSGLLQECLSCHAVRDASGTPVAVPDERHFCVACHAYAAVRPDCWECHVSTPDAPGHHAAAR